MELKVACYCGQKYKFDVEPVDGRMPFTVNCPVCGVDGTPLANHLLTQQASAPAPVLAPAPAAAPASAPGPWAAALAPMPLPAAPAPMSAPMPPIGTGLKVNRPPPAAAAPPPLPPGAGQPALAGGAPRPMAAAPRPIAPPKPAAGPKVQKEYSLGMGVLGAFLGAAIGGALVYGFFAWLNLRFPLTGTVTGLLAGYGARLMARGTDMTLGAIAAALTVLTIGGVFYLIYLQYDIFYVTGIISVIIGASFAFRISSG